MKFLKVQCFACIILLVGAYPAPGKRLADKIAAISAKETEKPAIGLELSHLSTATTGPVADAPQLLDTLPASGAGQAALGTGGVILACLFVLVLLTGCGILGYCCRK